MMRPIQHIYPLEVSASQEPPLVAETRVGDTVRGDHLQEEGKPNIPCGVKMRSGHTVRLPMKFKTETRCRVQLLHVFYNDFDL
ncbi:hypothetical protein PR048_008137 [Dryococelus australis]|uniref:Uncharacterized protein n=1 Tax=Dryococelus australis TaxID=614101 RepID=A0ABQ9HW91_9NEOP|nr:hypothetical protein PR048_008137 [Dryococelus australis]